MEKRPGKKTGRWVNTVEYSWLSESDGRLFTRMV